MADPTNAQIAAALRRARRPLRARRRGVLPRDRLPQRGQGRARLLGVVIAMAREGRVTESRASARRSRRSCGRSTRPATSRRVAKLRAKFPTGLIAVMHLPGLRAQARAAALRRARHRLARRAARGRRGGHEIRGLRGFGAKVEEKLLADARDDGTDGGPAPRVLLSRARSRSPSRSSARCAPHPARERVEVAGSLRRAGRLRQGPRHHRHRRATRRRSRARSPSCRSSSRCRQPATPARA